MHYKNSYNFVFFSYTNFYVFLQHFITIFAFIFSFSKYLIQQCLFFFFLFLLMLLKTLKLCLLGIQYLYVYDQDLCSQFFFFFLSLLKTLAFEVHLLILKAKFALILIKKIQKAFSKLPSFGYIYSMWLLMIG